MKLCFPIAVIAIAMNGTIASAQPAANANLAPEPAAMPVVSRALPASTLVAVTPDAEITSKRIEVGQKVGFVVVNDVVNDGAVVIPRGSSVVASVNFKTGKAIGGKSGKFEVTFERVNVRGKDYAMRGVHRQEGKGNTVAAVFGSILVSGRSAVMQPGQFANAFTAEAIPY